MLSKSMSCLNDDSEDDLFPNSPESAEESFTSSPHSEPHDAVLNDLMPPRPSSDGDQPTSTSNKTFKCTRCKYETDRKNNLKRHITTMHDPAPSTLDCCGTRFATKGDLREHTKAAHGIDIPNSSQHSYESVLWVANCTGPFLDMESSDP
ncbi:hypothetical protein HAZT_HAZT011210 [Hyalella azteca]|uniref:C2H2-type domain-containing protein n=1 Tax=Hyalella azteca TaxID=294128 RepID=A0A6A0HAQ7_HYAAZ|nr:hypothetical protein HAZT_HAZT011210 [Hyalella azteca]